MLPKIDWSDNQIREFFGASEEVSIVSENTSVVLSPYQFFILRRYNDSFFTHLSYCCCIYKPPEQYIPHNIRENFPTEIRFSNNGFFSLKISFFKHGKRHRAFNRPAILIYLDDILLEEAYYKLGNRHNINGPAHRFYENGKWINCFYINNNRLSLDGFINFYKGELK